MSDENLFLEHEHRASRRLAVLEDDGTSAWLYISEAGSRKPLADAWVYNRITAPSAEAIKSYREDALCEDPSSHEWSFVWSPDGESVAVAKDGEPVAFIISGEKGGYSRELVKDGPWGHPWSEERFRLKFGAA